MSLGTTIGTAIGTKIRSRTGSLAVAGDHRSHFAGLLGAAGRTGKLAS